MREFSFTEAHRDQRGGQHLDLFTAIEGLRNVLPTSSEPNRNHENARPEKCLLGFVYEARSQLLY